MEINLKKTKRKERIAKALKNNLKKRRVFQEKTKKKNN